MNSKVSKRFKKKMKNFRQGMTAWRVISQPISQNNYITWGQDQEELDRNHGKGNSTCFKIGDQWIFIRCERKCNVPTKTVWGWLDKFDGKRRIDQFKSLQSMWGSDGGRFFKNQFQAQAFMQEIMKGMHPGIIGGNIYFHGEMDRLDEMLLGCDDDRHDFDDDQYPYDEAEFA